MSPRVSDDELRRLAIDGVAAEIRFFGAGHPGSRVLKLNGVLAAVVPAAPDRSVFNSVAYESPAALAAAIDGLAATYERAGVRAWTVWVPDDDHASAALLGEHGHALDANPRAMGLDLADLEPGPGAEIDVLDGDAALAARLNDRAYGYEGPAFAAALSQPTADSLRWYFAASGGEPIACLALIPAGDDAVVTAVATDPGQRGRGVAGTLLRRALDEARSDWARTSSLQATKLGSGVYARLGFRDLGGIGMWERRSPAPGA
jgi:GNAT superfamily N-acetyltransferase